MKTISRRDYLRFFEEVLAHYEEDFPSGLIERETVTQVPGCKILKTYDIARWSVAHLGMYEFTGEESYRQRALELVRGVVSGYLRTPRALWDYYWINTPQGLAACREAYRAVPAHATWHGYAWWHVGGAAEPLGLSQICDILDRTGGWPDRQLRRDAHTALAWTTDYQVLDAHQRGRRHSYAWMRGRTHNIAMTMTRGILGAARALPDHPHAAQWRAWAMETFDRSYNRLSPEDASGYESDWFHSILTMIDILGKGEDAYHLAYHRSYFEHFREMVTPAGSVVGYGDSGDMGNAAVLPILEKGATVLRDGSYKDAAHRHFRAVAALPADERSGFVEPLRWFDAYRWADDSVAPDPARPRAAVTQRAKVVLRSGRPPEQAYLAISSVEGGGHGHFDAAAIAHLSLADCALLQDGQYHWKHAFYHNRLLWRAGTAPGRLLDYFRPITRHWHPSADGKTNVFASEGSSAGVADDWQPAAEGTTSVRFLAGMRGFSACRTVLGPQQRTIALEAGGQCLVFDHLRTSGATTTAACLYYVTELVERGRWWVRAGTRDRSRYHLLIASLEPRLIAAEPEQRRNTTEQVVYSSRAGDFSGGTWFVTALWPLADEAPMVDPSRVLQTGTIVDPATREAARVVTLHIADVPVTYVCRAGGGDGAIRYGPTTPDGDPLGFTVRTDAELLRLTPAAEGPDAGLEATVIHGTYLEADGRRLVSLPYPGNARTNVAALA